MLNMKPEFINVMSHIPSIVSNPLISRIILLDVGGCMLMGVHAYFFLQANIMNECNNLRSNSFICWTWKHKPKQSLINIQIK